ncbi:hypothetical protein [Methylobacterium gregans]|uniref:hypothetical protein n=1 Tax=Methylobacterium gregans TaxID=374424 RepID=UPI00361B256D
MPHPDRRSVLKGGLALGTATLAGRASRAEAAPVVRVDDPRLGAIVDPEASLATLYAEGRWCEGPCWAPALGGLVFSDVKANRILVLAGGRAGPARDLSGARQQRQRQHARRAGPPRHLRASRAAGGAARGRRHPHGAGRRL